MSIKLRHKDNSDGLIYTLDGSTLSWERNGRTNYAGGYTEAEIKKYFDNGTWVKIEEPPTPFIQAGDGSWTINVREGDGKFYAAGFGVGVTGNEEVKATSTADIAEGVSTKAVASDGGSSSYYDIGLPQWLVDKIVDRQKDGKAYVKTEELIEVGFNNDFDASNIFKSLVRAWGAFNGGGKKGNTVDYDLNKMKYSIEKLRSRFARKLNVGKWI